MPSRQKKNINQPSVTQLWASKPSVDQPGSSGQVTPEKSKSNRPTGEDDTSTTATSSLASSKTASKPESHAKDTSESNNDTSDSNELDSSDDEMAVEQESKKEKAKKLHFNEDNIRETTTKRVKPNHSGTVNPALLPMNTYKPVNHQSSNRRECTRLNENDHPYESTSSSRGTADEYMHTFKTRVSVKVTVPPSEKPETALMHRNREFMVELKSADDSIVIFLGK